jgi:hypothetical protein
VSTIVEVMIPHPGGTRPLKKVWHVEVWHPNGLDLVAASSVWQFTCIRNAEDFVAKGSTCARHDDSLGMCPRCKGKII